MRVVIDIDPAPLLPIPWALLHKRVVSKQHVIKYIVWIVKVVLGRGRIITKNHTGNSRRFGRVKPV